MLRKKRVGALDEKLGATRIASGLPVAYHGAEAVGWLRANHFQISHETTLDEIRSGADGAGYLGDFFRRCRRTSGDADSAEIEGKIVWVSFHS